MSKLSRAASCRASRRKFCLGRERYRALSPYATNPRPACGPCPRLRQSPGTAADSVSPIRLARGDLPRIGDAPVSRPNATPLPADWTTIFWRIRSSIGPFRRRRARRKQRRPGPKCPRTRWTSVALGEEPIKSTRRWCARNDFLTRVLGRNQYSLPPQSLKPRFKGFGLFRRANFRHRFSPIRDCNCSAFAHLADHFGKARFCLVHRIQVCHGIAPLTTNTLMARSPSRRRLVYLVRLVIAIVGSRSVPYRSPIRITTECFRGNIFNRFAFVGPAIESISQPTEQP